MKFIQNLILTASIIFFSISAFSQTILNVPSNSDWVPTGFLRSSGDEVIICSGGDVRGWPLVNTECWRWVTPSGIGRTNFTSASVPCTTCPVLSLIAKIGENGTPFYVGDRCVIQPSVTSASGEIFLRINDASINDNIGEWQVAIAKSCNDLVACFETPITPPGTVQVPGSSNWVPSGITRSGGEEVIICGNGAVKAWGPLETDCWRTVTPAGLGRYNYTSPSTPCPTCPVLSLIGKIGENGTPFFVGERGVIQITDTTTGEIYFRINDASLTDNSGEWSVSVVKDCAEIIDCFARQAVSTNNVASSQSNRIIVSPNPSEGSTNIQIQADRPSEAQVNVFDINGKILTQNRCILTAGENILTIQIPESVNNHLVIIQTILNHRTYSTLLMIK